MHAALVFQPRINTLAFDDGNDFFQTSNRRLRSGEYFHLPTLGFRVACVHPKHFGGKQSGFVAAGAGANFQDDIFFVVRILGKKQHFEFGSHCGNACFQFVELFLGIGAHLGIFFFREHDAAFSDSFFQIFVFAISLHHRRDFAVGLGRLLELRRITHDIGRG